MFFRMTIPQPLTLARRRWAPMRDWFSTVRRPSRASQHPAFPQTDREHREMRQLEQAWRVREKEEYWLWLSGLSDDEVAKRGKNG
jgi:hypothetical protein